MYHPRDYDIEKIPSDVENRLMNVILSLCKRMFGVQLHVENTNLKDFIKYPCCPEFAAIEKKVDHIKRFYFRADLNLFKCSENTNIDTLLGYKEHGVRKSFLENYGNHDNVLEKDN